MKRNNGLWKLVQAALFASLTCVATLLVHIPVPATGGYLNLGDAFVLLGALLLGPAYGFAAGGIGSMLADLIAGYAQYAPGTLAIKGLCALVAALLWAFFSKKLNWKPFIAVLLSCICAEVIMVLGYFAYESTILGYGLGAAAAIPGNAIQAAVGIVLVLPLFLQLRKVRPFSDAQ